MKNKHKLVAFYFLAFTTWILFQNFASNPPNGRTNAPFDGYCADCHSPNNGFDGTVTITGIPETVDAGETYNVTLNVSVTAGSPVRAGFQLVSVFDANNTNAGDLVATSNALGTENSGNREYIDHRNPQNFSNNMASWSFNWIAPDGPDGAVIKMYYAANITNGNSSSSGDRPISSNSTFTLSAQSVPLAAVITNQVNVMCGNENTGQATVEASGGTVPYTYLWSNGANTATATGLAPGDYDVTVTDNTNTVASASVTITQQDMLGPDIPTTAATLYLDATGQATYDLDPVLALIMDDCGVESTEFSENTFGCDDIGEQSVTIMASDAANNSSTGVVPLTILDTMSPFFTTCVEDIAAAPGEVVTYPTPVADDNCGVMSMVLTEGLASGNIFPEGQTKVSYMATDASGNLNCCSFFVTVEMTTDIFENALSENLKIYPNPVENQITISSSAGLSGGMQLTIFGHAGKLMYENLQEKTFQDQFSFDIAHLPAGMYFLKVDQNGLTAVRKIFKLSTGK